MGRAVTGPGPGRVPRSHRRTLLVVVALLAVVNLPLLHGGYTGWRLARSGVDVDATVTATRETGHGGFVEFTFDSDVDPEQRLWSAGVDADGLERATDDDVVRVSVVPGSPARYRVEGERGSGLLLVLTLFADAVLVAVGALAARGRPDVLRLVALEDVRLARPGGSLRQLDGTTFEVVGEVAFEDDEGLVLDLGDRSVRVDLDGHANPVGYEQPARVRARLPQSQA